MNNPFSIEVEAPQGEGLSEMSKRNLFIEDILGALAVSKRALDREYERAYIEAEGRDSPLVVTLFNISATIEDCIDAIRAVTER